MLQDVGRAADRRRRRDHQRRRVRPARRAGRARSTCRSIPTLMGWGAIPDDHRLMAGMVGLQTVAPVRQRHDAGVGLRARHRQPVGQPAHRRPRHLPARPHVRARRHRAHPDRPRVRARLRDRVRRGRRAGAVRRGGQGAQGGGCAPTTARGSSECAKRKRTMLRRTHFDDVPVKPQRVYEEMNRAFGRDTRYVSTIGLSQIAGGAVPARVQAAALDQRRAGGPAGLDAARGAGGVRGRPGRARSWRCRATTTSSSSSRSWRSGRSSTCPTSTSS